MQHSINVVAYGAFSSHSQAKSSRFLLLHSSMFNPAYLPVLSFKNLLNQNPIYIGKMVSGFVKYSIPIPGPEGAVTADAPTVPSCSIYPTSGTVLDAFEITCKATSFCLTGCLYCLKTNTGGHTLY